jgi:hypothetical protein
MASPEIRIIERKFGIWAKTDCDQCGCEFQVTRTEPKRINGRVWCSDCQQYEAAYNEGYRDGLAANTN